MYMCVCIYLYLYIYISRILSSLYVLNTQSEQNNTMSYPYSACFLNTLTLNMYVSMSYYRDQRAESGLHILVAAHPEYVNTY